VVHRLAFPDVISSDIVELSTAVYVTPSIIAVSPAVTFVHLQVPFSKYIFATPSSLEQEIKSGTNNKTRSSFFIFLKVIN
jgi:hypothetical protein